MARFEKGTTPKLTENLIRELADIIRGGAYVETAVALCGISKQTFYRWLKEAQSDGATELLSALSDAVKKALAEGELRDLAVIDKAAQEGVWQAAAWRLERKYPDRWGRQTKVQVEHSGPDGRPIEIIETRESLKLILSDPDTFTALEFLEEKVGRTKDDPNS